MKGDKTSTKNLPLQKNSHVAIIQNAKNSFYSNRAKSWGKPGFFEPREVLGEAGFLCPRCQSKIDTHHIVQCSNCQSVINFIEAEPSEEPVIYYTKKCSNCSGTLEDEKRIEPFYYSDVFI